MGLFVESMHDETRHRNYREIKVKLFNYKNVFFLFYELAAGDLLKAVKNVHFFQCTKYCV